MNMKKLVVCLLLTGILTIPCINTRAENINVDDIILELDKLSDTELEKIDTHLHELLGNTVNSDNEKKISDDPYRDEIFSQFEKYGIDVYDESEFKMFEGTDIPTPESVFTTFPEGEYNKDKETYTYSFEDSDEAIAYAKAYTLVLMGTDHEIEQNGDLILVDNDVVAFGLAGTTFLIGIL